MGKAPIQGTVQPGFERARAVFEENFTSRREVGAGFCAYHRGELVVDLWGGFADKATRRPWAEDSLCILFSSTKGLVATCFLMLAERGQLDYDATVASVWPEFAQAGKDRITIRQLLNHRAGLAVLDEPLSIEDLGDSARVASALEAQAPIWEPGTSQGYHGITFGLYTGELFKRLSGGTTVGRFLADEVAGPLGADLHLGLPATEDERVATLYTVAMSERLLRAVPYVLFNPKAVERRLLRALVTKTSDTVRALSNPAELGPKGIPNFERPNVRRLELPWANAYGTARGLATVYAALAAGGSRNGVTLVTPQTLAPVHKRQSFQQDRVLHKPLGWSQGFIKEETHLFSPNEASFGHPGAGGAVGFCDPDRELAWAYVMNRMDFRLRSPRALALSQSLYECLDG